MEVLAGPNFIREGLLVLEILTNWMLLYLIVYYDECSCCTMNVVSDSSTTSEDESVDLDSTLSVFVVYWMNPEFMSIFYAVRSKTKLCIHDCNRQRPLQ